MAQNQSLAYDDSAEIFFTRSTINILKHCLKTISKPVSLQTFQKSTKQPTMKLYIYFLLFVASLMAPFACKTKQITVTAPIENIENEVLDTLVISDVASAADSLPKIYRASAPLRYDIVHTRLDLSFDWNKQHVLGTADLTIKAYFKPIKEITLDAVGFDIHAVSNTTSGKNLTFHYDGKKLHITLDKVYSNDEKSSIRIRYTAKPNENTTSGSEAITSNKGLFFIDPLDTDPEVPSQIWTQGETENNSRWFPTYDKPNERFSQEIILTVEDKYLTLSNGKLISSVKNANGTRTDHWKQEKPHAPYLAMIAVGEFHEEKEMWKNIPLHYFVEKNYAPYAKKIFNHTPEMLSFFSEKLKYAYPWDKYAQIVVRNYVSGAMENTGAVVFGDFVQKTDRELINNDNDQIVAHEMMHHWFGDLVTCEDWSNLTLNEGFANYAEYLWFEYKYGRDRAEFHRFNEMNGYYAQVFSTGAHPLVHYFYDDKENMFDAHSYNKGGLVLHMLRNYVGDEAFFAALNRYLKDNENTAVEVDELRLAFEDTVGEDLNWFFDQWFLGSGHPYLDVQYSYDDEHKTLIIETDQSNTPKGFQVPFKLPVEVAIYYPDGSVQYHPVTIKDVKQKIIIENLKMKPSTYVLDGRNTLLALINENKTTEQYQAQFKLSSNLMDKMVAFSNTNDGNATLIEPALKEKFYAIRSMAISTISDSLAAIHITALQDLALTDPHSEVRLAALSKLLNLESFNPVPLCKLVLASEKSFPVLGLALDVMGNVEPENSATYFEKFKDEPTDFLASALVNIMHDEKPEYLDFIIKKSTKINEMFLFDFFDKYQSYLNGKSLSTIAKASASLADLAGDKAGNMYRKFLAMESLVKIANDLDKRQQSSPTPETANLINTIQSHIKNIVEHENNPTLREKYSDIK
jgi:aminopeptidase N